MIMTNQEWLATVSPEEFIKIIHWLQKDYGKRFAFTDIAIAEWLEKEHSDDNEQTRTKNMR